MIEQDTKSQQIDKQSIVDSDGSVDNGMFEPADPDHDKQKEIGNQCLKDGLIDEAIMHFTKAIVSLKRSKSGTFAFPTNTILEFLLIFS